ncbi:adenylyltransferase/cytidyltransferase family protein [Haliscomenobacter sp.]|uniref:adenylyltransferase/cytidyltransferase family protein n=1 Tax=Haliscomenobacter sp. TaxID=2717303 RepID=UPI003BAA91AD
MKIGFACGVFDLFHPGHVLMLIDCKSKCDYLLVAINKGENISKEINPDKKKPIYSLSERRLMLESCKYVDEVIEYGSEDELLKILMSRKIDIRFLGDDYIGKPITGASVNIQLYYIDRSHGYSTTNTIKKIVGQRSTIDKK